MKKLMILFACSGFLFACGNEPAVSAEEAKVQDAVDSAEAVDVFDQLEEELEAEEGNGDESGTEVMPNDAPESEE